MDFSQNSIVLIDLSINQIWKVKKRVTRSAKNIPRVAPKSNENILKKGVSGPMEDRTVGSMVQIMMLVAMTA